VQLVLLPTTPTILLYLSLWVHHSLHLFTILISCQTHIYVYLQFDSIAALKVVCKLSQLPFPSTTSTRPIYTSMFAISLSSNLLNHCFQVLPAQTPSTPPTLNWLGIQVHIWVYSFAIWKCIQAILQIYLYMQKYYPLDTPLYWFDHRPQPVSIDPIYTNRYMNTSIYILRTILTKCVQLTIVPQQLAA